MPEKSYVDFDSNSSIEGGNSDNVLRITIRPQSYYDNMPRENVGFSEEWINDATNRLLQVSGSTIDSMINTTTDGRLPIYIKGIGKLTGGISEIYSYQINLKEEINANGNEYRAEWVAGGQSLGSFAASTVFPPASLTCLPGLPTPQNRQRPPSARKSVYCWQGTAPSSSIVAA